MASQDTSSNGMESSAPTNSNSSCDTSTRIISDSAEQTNRDQHHQLNLGFLPKDEKAGQAREKGRSVLDRLPDKDGNRTHIDDVDVWERPSEILSGNATKNTSILMGRVREGRHPYTGTAETFLTAVPLSEIPPLPTNDDPEEAMEWLARAGIVKLDLASIMFHGIVNNKYQYLAMGKKGWGQAALEEHMLFDLRFGKWEAENVVMEELRDAIYDVELSKVEGTYDEKSTAETRVLEAIDATICNNSDVTFKDILESLVKAKKYLGSTAEQLLALIEKKKEGGADVESRIERYRTDRPKIVESAQKWPETLAEMAKREREYHMPGCRCMHCEFDIKDIQIWQ